MAIIWQKTINNCCYEVRRAGSSVRLYNNGIFHSQWNSQRPFAGDLWGLLFLPALLHCASPTLKEALVLGVGGGAVINLLNLYLDVALITGVDLDKQHLILAKKYFLAHTDNVRLVREDAAVFVENSPRSRVDFIVEDLFCDNEGEAVRAVEVDKAWLGALSERLNDGGVLVFNFESAQQLRRYLTPAAVKSAGFRSLYQFSLPRYENAIAVCLKQATDKRTCTKKIETFLASRPARETRDIAYHIMRVL